ncbi:MAG: DUF1353 domain-containing protein [Deltaproteobacteria bacterium]|nr:DUF1353 domain-containing protein [Deltaproteobacteria bacterium]
MKVLDIKNCKSDLCFPIVQAVPIKQEKNPFKRFFKFITFRRQWKIREDYCLWVPSICTWIFIPQYFVFDGASVPKILNSIYSPTGMLLLGAAPHDFGYRYEGLLQVDYRGCIYFVSYTKKELDDIFDHICAYESGMNKASKVATVTLGTVGFLGWKENRKKNYILMEDFPELFIPEDVN